MNRSSFAKKVFVDCRPYFILLSFEFLFRSPGLTRRWEFCTRGLVDSIPSIDNTIVINTDKHVLQYA